MGFNEKVQAYIAARYYVHLTGVFEKRGKAAFILAEQYYAEQRGRRMAQRAIRDGKELDYSTYEEYIEWVGTEDMEKEGCASKSEILAVSPDFELKITSCPWYEQFKEMGLSEAGIVYCSELDKAICRGFNPYLQYEVCCTLHTSDCCLHVVREANLAENEVHELRKEYVRNFEYHCAHIYWSFREIIEAVFGEEGERLAEAVLNDIQETYGKTMMENLLKYRKVNFNICDNLLKS